MGPQKQNLMINLSVQVNDMIPEKLYRYEAGRYSVIIDAEMELFGTSKAKLECREYIVTAETPKGYWIGYLEGAKFRWVSKTSHRRFAHPTKEEALEAYRQRKTAYVRHSKARLRTAEEDLSLVVEPSRAARLTW